jgi:hypothetical protein
VYVAWSTTLDAVWPIRSIADNCLSSTVITAIQRSERQHIANQSIHRLLNVEVAVNTASLSR